MTRRPNDARNVRARIEEQTHMTLFLCTFGQRDKTPSCIAAIRLQTLHH